MARAADPGAGASPILVHRRAGCLVIEVVQEIGPAAEPHLGRLLHGAIRPGGTSVLVDLRRTTDLGVSGLSVLRLARTLADLHGLTFGFVGDIPSAPALPAAALPSPGRAAAVSEGGVPPGPTAPAGVCSALPPPRSGGRP